MSTQHRTMMLPIEISDLVRRLRELARYEHSDTSIGDEAADLIQQMESAILGYRQRLYLIAHWCQADMVEVLKHVGGLQK